MFPIADMRINPSFTIVYPCRSIHTLCVALPCARTNVTPSGAGRSGVYFTAVIWNLCAGRGSYEYVVAFMVLGGKGDVSCATPCYIELFLGIKLRNPG